SSAGIIVRTSVFSPPPSPLVSVGRCHSRVQLANSHLVDVDETPPSSAAVHLYATDADSIGNCGTYREFCPCNPIRRHAFCCERLQNGYHRSGYAFHLGHYGDRKVHHW